MNKIKFSLNKEFYKKEFIEQALNDFSEICNGKVDNELKIELEPLQEHDFSLKDEFCNYVFGLMHQE
jgi:hypothetical protein